jgi:phosphate:Na+ symporter
MVPFISKLVLFLEKYIQPKKSVDEIGHEGTLYLNDSVLEFPQSSLEAIIKETKHLYDNAFEIIAHGLNLKRSKIASSLDLEEVIKTSYAKKPVDIEELYEKKVKDIYSELITFSTRAQTNMPPKSIEELYKIKLASRDIVEALKNTKHLQKNILKFAAHPNQQIKKEYANIKISLAELLRNINIIATTDENDVILLLLSKIRINTQKNDILSNGRLDELIRTKQITNQMATSLMNDSVYVYNIRSKLSSVAQTLFIDANSELKALQEEMQITQSEVETLLEKQE